MSFAHLLAPGRIGSLELRNRIIMAPMGSNLAEPSGHINPRIIRYYEARARGGVGMVIVGVGAVAFPAGVCIPNQVAIADDAFMPGLHELTQRLHVHGAKVAIQLQHGGKVARQDMEVGRPMWVPSVPTLSAGDLLNDLSPEELQGVIGHLAKPGAAVRFHEMSAEDIDTLIEMFAAAALRARRAGFDAVEIHAAHGYLIAAFLSPAANHRTDAYGGSLENRARLLCAVIAAVKERVGADFPVWCRLDGRELHIDNGITPEDAQRVAILAEAAGADAVHVTAYADPRSGVAFTDAPLVHQPCGYVALAKDIRRRVRIPVIAVGRIEPEEADALIGAGKIDFVAMARKLLADPELANKLAAGQPDAVRPCTYGYGCVGNIFLNRSVACTVNPATGREAELSVGPAAKPRRILIAGGGPAGMEAARLAAIRGHQVTLCEQREQLGGSAAAAALVYAPNGALLQSLQAQLRKLPIEVRLGQKVTASLVHELRPDVVLLALGAGPALPAIEGMEAPRVVRAQALSEELMRAHLQAGARIVVIGGGLIGLSVAENAIERDCVVTVLASTSLLGGDMPLPRRWRSLATLRRGGAALLTDARVDTISATGVVFLHGGEHKTAAADLVVLADSGQVPQGVDVAFAESGAEIHLLGDCREIGLIEGALLDAARVTQRL